MSFSDEPPQHLPGSGASSGDPAASTHGSTPARRFQRIAAEVLDVLLEHQPALATSLGDHRFDDRLEDQSATGVERRARELSRAVAALDVVDIAALPAQDAVDLEVLRVAASGQQWSDSDLRPHEWDPLVHLPGEALHGLLARQTGEPADRLRALAARMRAIPEALAVARSTLTAMPRVHVETAAIQTEGSVQLLGPAVDGLLDRVPALRAEVDGAREAARIALRDHAAWLRDQIPDSTRDPRLGARAYAAKLWYCLDSEVPPETILTRAESDLMAVEEQVAEHAGRLAAMLGLDAARDGVPAVLDAVARTAPVTDADVLPGCSAALRLATAAVRRHDWVEIPEAALGDGVRVVQMPQWRRGVAVAYADPPGALEGPGPDGQPLPTFFAVSPTPADWPPEQVESFYREYNGHMLRNLTVHEAMPGHVLQLAHARRFSGSTPVRAALASGTFVEGWAVYAEELAARAGLHDGVVGADPLLDAALRITQLKMQLRTTLNAILDVRVHAAEMTQDEARRLLRERGHQEAGEIAGKWRRVQLTAGQLPTYYLGYRAVLAAVAGLRAAHPDWPDRRVHDALLAHGSPPPRHLARLLGLAPA